VQRDDVLSSERRAKPADRRHVPVYDLNAHPSHLADFAVSMARIGYPKEAFQALLRAYGLPGRKLNDLMLMLPTIIYLSYRYLQPSDLVSAITLQILPVLQSHSGKLICDRTLLNLAFAQIACAFNERGAGIHARRFFERDDIHVLLSERSQIARIWPITQIVRSQAHYWVEHGKDFGKAIEIANLAKRMNSDMSNERGAATIMIAALLNDGRNCRAWECHEEFYVSSKRVILTATKAGSAAGDIVHLASSLFHGAVGRHFAGEKYSQSEREEDLGAMRWCLTQQETIALADGSFFAARAPMPMELRELVTLCVRPKFGSPDVKALESLQQMLTTF
jgi:hypothetical protein